MLFLFGRVKKEKNRDKLAQKLSARKVAFDKNSFFPEKQNLQHFILKLLFHENVLTRSYH